MEKGPCFSFFSVVAVVQNTACSNYCFAQFVVNLHACSSIVVVSNEGVHLATHGEEVPSVWSSLVHPSDKHTAFADQAVFYCLPGPFVWVKAHTTPTDDNTSYLGNTITIF